MPRLVFFSMALATTTSYGHRSVVRAGYIWYAITRNTDAGELNAANTTANGFCLSCMREAGIQAYEIFAMPRDMEARQLRVARWIMETYSNTNCSSVLLH